MERGCEQGCERFAHKIVVNEGKWLEGIGATEPVTVMSRAEYELYDFLAQFNLD